MTQLIQCVPNFSEGQDKRKVNAIVEAIKSVSGIRVIDVEMDPNHNRSVVTFFGDADNIGEAAFQGAKKAVEVIDMRNHKGEHPRMGATDVIPFTPIFGTAMADCVTIAEILGERLGRELGIPVYLYDRAAKRSERVNLAYVRKGEFEGISKEIETNPDRKPDFGPSRIHPTAGATAVGAREHIINFNVNLESSDMELAKTIAKNIRTSSGGLPSLRAKEIELSDRKKTQVSTVLTNYKETGLAAVSSAIEQFAAKSQVQIEESELIGLVPCEVLIDFVREKLKVKTFQGGAQILELRLLEMLASQRANLGWVKGLSDLCEALSSVAPVPGGGSASAGMAALGAALSLKVFRIQENKAVKKGDIQAREKAKALARECENYLRQFLSLAEKDARAYEGVVSAYKKAKTDPQRAQAIEEALKQAASEPLEVLRTAIGLAGVIYPVKDWVDPNVASDLKVGLHALFAGCLGAKENVLVNLETIIDKRFISDTKENLESLEVQLKTLATTR